MAIFLILVGMVLSLSITFWAHLRDMREELLGEMDRKVGAHEVKILQYIDVTTRNLRKTSSPSQATASHPPAETIHALEDSGTL